MNAGQLRDRVTIRREIPVSNGKGGYTLSWLTLANDIAANVVSLNGREALLGSVLQGISAFQITIRYRTDIQASDQILWKGRELNVHNAEDRAGTRTWTTIQASNEAPQGA